MKIGSESSSEKTGVQEVLHLTQRFFGSIRPGAPADDDIVWAESFLSPAEVELWRRMSNPDKRHAVAVGREVAGALGEHSTTPILVAAILHDVGKIQSAYRTPARCMATVIWAIVPNSKAQVWAQKGRPFKRLGEYRRHPEIGEGLLRSAGSDELPTTWAADHHRPVSQWRVDQSIGQILKDCDDD